MKRHNPFKSERQRRYLWSQHPDVVRRWAHENPTRRRHRGHVEKLSDAQIVSGGLSSIVLIGFGIYTIAQAMNAGLTSSTLLGDTASLATVAPLI
jgi:hypothetical protein